MSATKLKLKPILSIDCTGCPANAHQFELVKEIHCTGNCGEKRKCGDCFGIISYPIKNPSQDTHESFCRSVKFNAEKA